ncbi:MAG: dipeptidase [Clostridia bacterium]|nr:dipeptidase [Clostridia bacterium]
MNIFDLHCDTLSLLTQDKKYPLYENYGHVDLKRLREGNVVAQCFAIFLPQSNNETDTSKRNFKLLKKQYKVFKRQLQNYSGLISQAESAEQIDNNIKENKISAILTVENGDFIGNDLTRLNVIKSMGVKSLGLVWNFENSIAYPNSSGVTNASPLKPLGKEVIEILNNLNIIPDVSHLNYGGFWDVARLSKKPFIASHSCCDTLFHHQRNLEDSQLKAIAESGGTIGINFYTEFIKPTPSATFTSDIIAQAKHIKKVAGIEAVSFGSDFDGMDSLMEFRDCAGFPLIVKDLLKEFTYDECEKICYRNALRVLGG